MVTALCRLCVVAVVSLSVVVVVREECVGIKNGEVEGGGDIICCGGQSAGAVGGGGVMFVGD